MCQSYTLCVEIMNCTYVDTAYCMLKSEFLFTFTVKNTLDRKITPVLLLTNLRYGIELDLHNHIKFISLLLSQNLVAKIVFKTIRLYLHLPTFKTRSGHSEIRKSS